MPPELYQHHMRSQGSEDYSNLGQNIQDPSYYDIQWKKLDSWFDEITFELNIQTPGTGLSKEPQPLFMYFFFKYSVYVCYIQFSMFL